MGTGAFGRAGDAPPGAAMAEAGAALLDFVADGVLATDERGVVQYASAAAGRLFRLPLDRLVGGSVEQLMPARHADGHGARLAGFAQGGVATRWMSERAPVMARRGDGTEFPAEITIAKWPTAAGLRLVAVVRDVTERQRTLRWEQLLARAGTGVAGADDITGALDAVLEAAVPALGAWALLDLLPGDHGEPVLRRRASASLDPALDGALRSLERLRLSPDAPSPVVDVIRTGRSQCISPVDEAWLEAHSRDAAERAAMAALAPRGLVIVPVPSRDRVIGALTIGLTAAGPDLASAIERPAATLAGVAGLELGNALLYRAAERAVADRDRVLHIVAHDLRNLSSASRMCAIALEEDTDADAEYRAELLATIRESSDAIHRLVADLVDLAAIDRGRFAVRRSACDPGAVAMGAAALFRERAAAAGLHLETRIEHGLPTLLLDRDRIAQALTNLLDNAVKFTPSGGTITISAAADPGAVLLGVSDTGPGIPEATLAALLAAEWRSRAGPEGSGLGLPITRGIAAAHGGTLEGESVPGRGATFRLVLPRGA